MDVKLGKDTLIALASVAWADGTMAPEEADSLRSAAAQLELGPDEREAMDEAVTRSVDPTLVETVKMNRPTRLFVYAAATWIASVDGQITSEEQKVLGLLGDRLGLSDKARERARQVALSVGEVRSSTGGYDLLALKGRVENELTGVGDD